MTQATGSTTNSDMSQMQHEDRLEMRDGEDFVCPNCGCEIMLKHHGDPEKMPNMGP